MRAAVSRLKFQLSSGKFQMAKRRGAENAKNLKGDESGILPSHLGGALRSPRLCV